MDHSSAVHQMQKALGVGDDGSELLLRYAQKLQYQPFFPRYKLTENVFLQVLSGEVIANCDCSMKLHPCPFVSNSHIVSYKLCLCIPNIFEAHRSCPKEKQKSQ